MLALSTIYIRIKAIHGFYLHDLQFIASTGIYIHIEFKLQDLFVLSSII